MELYKLCCLKVLVILVWKFLVTKAIINNNAGFSYANRLGSANYKTLQTGTFYLNRNRPLWILQDPKPQGTLERNQKPLRDNVKYDHIKPIYVRRRQSSRLRGPGNYRNFKTKAAQKRITFYNGQHLKLPSNYIPLQNNNNQRTTTYFTPSSPPPQLPKFDSTPGEESFEKSQPLFVYTGQRGRMLFNTMMSSYKYPMQEPIPGQTLYPPAVVRIKTPPQETTPLTPPPINVTMIPFYAYEAIDPRMINNNMYTTATTTASSPLPLSDKAKKSKKPKKYSAYYASQDILGQPYDSTTSMPLTLEKPFGNHRDMEATTASLGHKTLEVTYNDGEDKFRITYEDEDRESGNNLERPTEVTTQTPPPPAQSHTWPYGNYEMSHSYYTLPFFPLGGRRLEGEGQEDRNHSKQTPEDYRKLIEGTDKPTENPAESKKSTDNTWFILNSRYKGPLKSNTKNLHSSKYIQTTRSIQDDRDFLQTTTPTTAITKAKLKPQMRALYGDNIQIVI